MTSYPEERPGGVYRIEGPVWPRKSRSWQVIISFDTHESANGFTAWLTALRDGGHPHHEVTASPQITWLIGGKEHSMLPPPGQMIIVQTVDVRTNPQTGQGHVIISAYAAGSGT